MSGVDARVPGFEILNLGASATTELDRLSELIAQAKDLDPMIRRLPPQPGDVTWPSADISKAKRVLERELRGSIDDGVPGFVTWFEDTYGR